MSWLGRIYMSRIPDDQGRYIDHDHPVMVLQGPSQSGDINIVAISTDFEPPAGRLMLECPWADGGDPQTGLMKPCVLKCWWVLHWHKSKLKNYLGMMPAEIVAQATDYVITAVEEKKREELRHAAANLRSV